MRLSAIALITLFVSCSRIPIREIASVDSDYNCGEVNLKNSSVRLFRPEVKEEISLYNFYLQLKNSHGEYVDCESKSLVLKNKKREKIPFVLERSLKGRYYISVKVNSNKISDKLDFFIDGRLLKEHLKMALKHPDPKFSKIKILNKKLNEFHMELYLGDSKGKPIQTSTAPEFIVEGHASVEDVRMISKGVWEFNLVYPERNEIIYISVRANGTYLERMFRIQHIER